VHAEKVSAMLADCFFLSFKKLQQRLAKWPFLSHNWQ
jgi:hypothetical protein